MTKIKNIFPYIFLVLSACSIPHDPENSWEKANSDFLKVGLIHNPPFVISENEQAAGKEVEMIKKFAKQNSLNIEYVRGSESDLIKKLKHYELHLLAGGFKKSTIWKKHAGPTRPYDKEKHVLLVPKGENKLLFQLESFIYKYKDQ